MTAIAYMASRYPAVSHTFILDEVARLRSLGHVVHVASINEPDRAPEAMTAQERDEARDTYFVKRAGLRGALAAHLVTAVARPRAYLAGLAQALRRGGLDPLRVAKGFCYFVEAVMLGHWMQRVGASHLHVHFANPASTVGSIARRTFPISFSITVHGSPPFHDEPGLWFRETAADADFICCISHYCRSQVMLRSPPGHWSRFEVTPMGVDTRRFRFVARAPHDGPVEVLCVGRLSPVKGHDVLLGALRRLRLEGRNVRLRLVGDGPERGRLEALAAHVGLGDLVSFEGNVNRDDILAHYARADVFALSSLTEGVPVVLMEALATGLPCVAPQLAGIPELIRHEQEGLLFIPGDEASLASALGRLIDDGSLRERLARAGRARVEATHDVEQTARLLSEVFHNRLAMRELPPGTGARTIALSERGAPA